MTGCSAPTSVVDDSGAVVGGPALDQALWTAPGAHKIGLASYRRLAERPFDYERRIASVLVEGPDETRTVIVKGAPELVSGTVSRRSAEGAVGARRGVLARQSRRRRRHARREREDDAFGRATRTGSSSPDS